MNEIETAAAAALPELPRLLEQWLPAGRWHGREYVVGDLGGGEGDSLSINSDSGMWSDFATGESGGDPVSLYAAIYGYGGDHPQLSAARDLAAEVGANLEQPQSPGQARGANQESPGQKQRPEPILPVPAGAPAPPDQYPRKTSEGAWERLEIAYRWDYRDETGELLGHVARVETDGGKEVIPQTFCRLPDGSTAWKWLSFPKPRPLYGLDRLATAPAANVVIVEGEKAADAGQRLLADSGVIVISWPGGGNAAKHVEWSALAGRKIVAWPDADGPGLDAMEGITDSRGRNKGGVAQFAGTHAAGFRVVDPPADVAEGWDLADAEAAGWTADDVLGWIRRHVREPQRRDYRPAAEEPPPPDPEDMPLAPFDEPDAGGGEDDPFVCLGYDHSAYYYLPKRTQQVTRLPTSAHTKVNLLELAPLSWWEAQFPGKQGPDWLRAADMLIAINARRVYDPSRTRGAGAWYDEGRAVLHLGDHLLVDGAPQRMTEISSRYIYEAGAAIEGAPVEHLTTKDANKLVELCERLEWESPISGRLLAGWCMVAPICGAMSWRPHIWLTGASGCGKSWIAEHIVQPCIGPTALPVQGHTTEAGIRQALRQDARPILFDEAEAEDKQGRGRIQAILDLARQASSEANGAILKGSAGGQSMVFRVRSSFCLVSVGMSLQQQADQTRWSKLVLRRNTRPTAAQEFAEIEEQAATLLTPQYCAALRARAYRMIPTIRENARVFATAAATCLGSQRLGDQMGALLAGCYALFSSGTITHDEARQWLERQEWAHDDSDPVQPDEDRLIAEIVQTPIRVDLERGGTTRSVAELIEGAVHGDNVVGDRKANQILARHGIRTQLRDGVEYVLISCSHRELRRILEDSPWSLSWPEILRRAPGAIDVPCARFGGHSTRAVGLPMEVVQGGGE